MINFNDEKTLYELEKIGVKIKKYNTPYDDKVKHEIKAYLGYLYFIADLRYDREILSIDPSKVPIDFCLSDMNVAFLYSKEKITLLHFYNFNEIRLSGNEIFFYSNNVLIAIFPQHFIETVIKTLLDVKINVPFLFYQDIFHILFNPLLELEIMLIQNFELDRFYYIMPQWKWNQKCDKQLIKLGESLTELELERKKFNKAKKRYLKRMAMSNRVLFE